MAGLFDLYTELLMGHEIVDASFVNIPRQHNAREENADIKKGVVPLTYGKKNKNEKRSKLS